MSSEQSDRPRELVDVREAFAIVDRVRLNQAEHTDIPPWLNNAIATGCKAFIGILAIRNTIRHGRAGRSKPDEPE